MNQFESHIKKEAETIINKYGYCLVTPLFTDNMYGIIEPLSEPIECYNIECVKELYYENSEIRIDSPIN